MNKNTKITLIKNLDITDLDGDKVMVDFETGKYFLLKGTANDIWNCIQSPVTIDQIRVTLMQDYDVSEEECLSGIISFLQTLKENNFILAVDL